MPGQQHLTAVFSVLTPPSQTISSWWKELAPLRPCALWVAELLVHRLDVLVSVHESAAGHSFPFFVLRTLAFSEILDLEGMERRLQIGPALLQRILRRLEREGFVRSEASGTWRLTSAGQQTVAQGSYRPAHLERRLFCFVENETPNLPFTFLDLPAESILAAHPAPEYRPMDCRILQACLKRPASWKEEHGFPLDVQEVHVGSAGPSPARHAPEPWQRVIIDQPERCTLALVLTQPAPSAERLLGFAIPDGPRLPIHRPAFSLGNDWREVLPDLEHDPPLTSWHETWMTWCSANGLAPAEAASCVLERERERLRACLPKRLVERLRTTHSEVFRNGAWVLAGTGRIRSAAVLDVKPLESRK